MTSDTLTGLATRSVGDRVAASRGGAVDEYSALHRAAIDGLIRHGLEAAAATLRLRAEAQRLELADGTAGSVVPLVAETEAAITEVHDEYRQLTVHVLRMARNRLGLC
jgi:predicted phage gp36 major capsid-like protein